MITFPSMISYGQIVWRKNTGSWLNLEKLVKRIKPMQLVGKESKRGIFLRGIKEKDQTTKMKEDQITGMNKDPITNTREGQTKEDKIEDEILNLQGSNVLVVMDMVTSRRIVRVFTRTIIPTEERGREYLDPRLKSVHRRDPKELILPMQTTFYHHLYQV